jgi:hypothetical protein
LNLRIATGTKSVQGEKSWDTIVVEDFAGCEADMRTVDRSNESGVNDPNRKSIRVLCCGNQSADCGYFRFSGDVGVSLDPFSPCGEPAGEGAEA